MAARQHLQKQKEIAQQQNQQQHQVQQQQQQQVQQQQSQVSSVISTSSNIHSSIIVKSNQLISPATNKIGSTISLIPKIETDTTHSWDSVPPLAPLSGHHQLPIRQSSAPVIASITPKVEEDATSTSSSNDTKAIYEGMLMPNLKTIGNNGDDTKDSSRLLISSQVVNSNKMLVDLLDRKSAEPPFNVMPADNTLKRKPDVIGGSEAGDDSSAAKRHANDEIIDVDAGDDDPTPKTPSSNAANLYAKLAASLLEDEDDEEMDIKATTLQYPIVQQQEPQKQHIISMPLPIQRQIIMSPQQGTQMMLSPGGQQQQMTTIKTENGYQSVPMIVQQSGGVAGQMNYQIGGQYMLATNNQGQTYLVAQQPQQQQQQQQPQLQQTQQQTLVVQGSGANKTIYILQQQPGASGGTTVISGQSVQQQTGQKVIMSTQQGQQMIMAQMPRPIQHHVITAGGNLIQGQAQGSGSMQNVISSQPQIVQQLGLPPIQNATQHLVDGGGSMVVSEKKIFITGQGTYELSENGQLVKQESVVVNQQQQQQQQVQIQQQPIQVQQPVQQQQVQMQQQQQQVPVQQSKVQQQKLTKPQQKQIQQQKQTLKAQQHQNPKQLQQPPPVTTPPIPAVTTKVVEVKDEENTFDPNWLFVCDWRGCAR